MPTVFESEVSAQTKQRDEMQTKIHIAASVALLIVASSANPALAQARAGQCRREPFSGFPEAMF